jgi:hypothetical protein
MMKFTLINLLWIATSFFSSREECTIPNKVLKEAGRQFGGPVEVHYLNLPEYNEAVSNQLNTYDCLFELTRSGETHGYLIKTRAKGRFDYFDYVIIFSSEGQVLEVVVTRYRSDHGAGICQRNWLKQFVGYNGEGLQLGKDIDGVTGGTISAASIIADIQRCHRLLGKIINH